MKLVLTIGNRNYSSWSLRAHLVMKHAGVPFEEEMIPLDTPEFHSNVRGRSPSARVPALRHDDLIIWDSLAIAEYAAETFAPKLWPEDRAARAIARSASAEMHSSFAALREHMPMNIRARHPTAGRTRSVLSDIERVVAIWDDCHARFGGPFLFGDRFGIADAMYAPVVTRFVTYGVALDGFSATYTQTILGDPAMAAWIRAAEAEPEALPREDYPPVRR